MDLWLDPRFQFDPGAFGERIQRVYSYWSRPLREGRLPTRADFDPIINIPADAAYMGLVRVEWDPFDLIYQLIGDGIGSLSSRRLIGKSVYDGSYSPDHAHTIADYEDIARTGKISGHRSLLANERMLTRLSRLALPLFDADTDRVVRIILVIEVTASEETA